MATIQWFPGHMSKARRQVQESIKFVDFVTVLVDARLPLSSQNPMLTKIVGEKPKLLILNKADLADPVHLKEWQTYFEGQGIPTLALNSKEQSAVKKVTDAAKKLMADKLARQKERGIRIETLRTMIIGIPNAGKSTLLNTLLNEERAIVSDIAGTTRDTIEETLHIAGVTFRFIDTAGIRDTQDKIEAIGVDKCKLCTYCWNGKE